MFGAVPMGKDILGTVLLHCLQTVVICMHCLCWRCLFGREPISTVDGRQTFFHLSKMHGIVGVSLMASIYSTPAARCLQFIVCCSHSCPRISQLLHMTSTHLIPPLPVFNSSSSSPTPLKQQHKRWKEQQQGAGHR
jgi:hypothetical protein